jgi:hypothetical protein
MNTTSRRTDGPEPGSQPFPDATTERRARGIAAQVARERVAGTNHAQIEHAIRDRDLADPEGAIAHRVDWLLTNATVHLELPAEADEFAGLPDRVRVVWEIVRRYSATISARDLAVMGLLLPSSNDLSRLVGDGLAEIDANLDAHLAVRETPGNSQGIIARRVVEARW